MYANTHKGRYRVKNPNKYTGDINSIIYRSAWELKFMKWCDENAAVLEWGSETTIIPYISPIDKQFHRYFVDFYIKVKNKENQLQRYLVEIKPDRFTKAPEPPAKMTKRFINEVLQFGINEAKWKAATEFCNDRKMKFIILTEHDLGIKR
jgi:hypothetical protein